MKIRLTNVYVDDQEKALGVMTTPTSMGPVRIAVIDDTCGNLIQLYET